MTDYFSEKFGISKTEIRKAVYKADEVQISFEKRLVDYGREIMNSIPANCRPVVLLGRPYNSTDPAS